MFASRSRSVFAAAALALGALAFSPRLQAAPASAAVRAEIDALLDRLASSGCEFNRNGSWYPAADAKSHLLRKLDYFERKGALASTEQFIELGASASSSSGRPYLVKCGNAAPVPSRDWLVATLASLRAGSRIGDRR